MVHLQNIDCSGRPDLHNVDVPNVEGMGFMVRSNDHVDVDLPAH